MDGEVGHAKLPIHVALVVTFNVVYCGIKNKGVELDENQLKKAWWDYLIMKSVRLSIKIH